MIKVTRLNNSQFWVNAELIQYIEETPDTVITLTTEDKIVVKEPAVEIIKAVQAFRRQIYVQYPEVIERED